jgi:hypothetical protein
MWGGWVMMGAGDVGWMGYDGCGRCGRMGCDGCGRCGVDGL